MTLYTDDVECGAVCQVCGVWNHTLLREDEAEFDKCVPGYSWTCDNCYDPTPYCSACEPKASCKCGPIAENE